MDDFDLLKESFGKNEKIIAVMAPAIEVVYQDTYLNFNGWLKSKGVAEIFDVSLDVDTTVINYTDFLNINDDGTIFTQTCPAIISFIERYHPEILPENTGTNRPVTRTINLVRRNFPEYKDYKILVVSLCIAKQRKINEAGPGDFNVTMKDFDEYFEKENIRVSSYPEVNFCRIAPESREPASSIRKRNMKISDLLKNNRNPGCPHKINHYTGIINPDIEHGGDALLTDCINCKYGLNSLAGKGKYEQEFEGEHVIKNKNCRLSKHNVEKSFIMSGASQNRISNRIILNQQQSNLEKNIRAMLKELDRLSGVELKNYILGKQFNSMRKILRGVNNIYEFVKRLFLNYYDDVRFVKHIPDQVKQHTEEILSPAGQQYDHNDGMMIPPAYDLFSGDEYTQSTQDFGQVIDDFTELTNMLTLNAAIEAAWKGDNYEVHSNPSTNEIAKIAEKTYNATIEIYYMIKKLKTGSGRSDKSGKEGTKKEGD
ncbi:MAG: [Fe-Fe] hydrogenase large subunit C-terminal domain-containing protein [Ignavibacteriaceae bacterium]